MTVTKPVLQMDAATRTWGLVSDGFIDINLTDDSFDALSFTFRVMVDSKIDPQDNINLLFDF